MTNRVRLVGFVALLLLSAATPALSQTTPPPARQDTSITVTLNGRMQFQWNTTSVDSQDVGTITPIPWSTFQQRRIRLDAGATFHGWIRGRVEADFAMGVLQVKQAWMSFQLDPAFIFRAGQFKKPFSVIELTSSTMGAVIERGLRIRNLNQVMNRVEVDAPRLSGNVVPGEEYALLLALDYLSYDMGVQVEGAHGKVGYAVGAFNGSGADVTDENSPKSIVGRVTVSPHVGGYPVRLGLSANYNTLNVPNTTSDTRVSGTAVELDLELGAFRRKGIWLLAEATTGENLASLQTFWGAQGVASYFHPIRLSRVEGVEPVMRVSWADPDDSNDLDAGVLYTPGFNVYFVGRNRLMFNVDIYQPQDDRIGTTYALRSQFNVYF